MDHDIICPRIIFWVRGKDQSAWGHGRKLRGYGPYQGPVLLDLMPANHIGHTPSEERGTEWDIKTQADRDSGQASQACPPPEVKTQDNSHTEAVEPKMPREP